MMDIEHSYHNNYVTDLSVMTPFDNQHFICTPDCNFYLQLYCMHSNSDIVKEMFLVHTPEFILLKKPTLFSQNIRNSM